VTAAEAFLLYMTKRGLEGDGAAARSTMAVIEEARSARRLNGGAKTRRIVRRIVAPGSVNTALEPLRMASKLDRFRPSARMMLEPWLVEEALCRLGDRRFSADEQATIVRATRTPCYGWQSGAVAKLPAAILVHANGRVASTTNRRAVVNRTLVPAPRSSSTRCIVRHCFSTCSFSRAPPGLQASTAAISAAEICGPTATRSVRVKGPTVSPEG
jgi:hypothetical protein